MIQAHNFCLVCYFDDIYGLDKFQTLDDTNKGDNCNLFILLLLQLNNSGNNNYNNNNNHNDTDKSYCYSHDVLYKDKSSIRH